MQPKPSSPFSSLLEVNDLILFVHLGCGQEERARPQEVRLQIKVAFREAPAAEITDQLEHSVCYAKMSEAVQDLIHQKEFALVEKLARDIYQALTPLIPTSASLLVKTHKVRPPVNALSGGVKYSCGDLSL